MYLGKYNMMIRIIVSVCVCGMGVAVIFPNILF